MNIQRHALVTGGARRIGAAISKMLSLDGWTVGIHHHTSEQDAGVLSKELKAEGAKTYILRADLSDKTELDSLLPAAIEAGGPLTCLVNNASVFEYDDASSVSKESWDLHMDINLWAPVRLSQQFAENLPKTEIGNIVNIADQRIICIPPDFLSYTISKAAMWAMTQNLALSMAPAIRVNAIGPGPTLPSPRQTLEEFHRQASHMPMGVGATPEEIAKGVLYILSTPSLTGQLIALDGGQHLGWDFPEHNPAGFE